MKAVDANLLDLLKVTSQFEVPIYQRAYAWGEPECEQLWKDILRAGQNSALGAHFTGSVVYIEKSAGTSTSQEPSLIIDGQQRVTTVSLLLAALARRLDKEEPHKQEPLEGFSPEEIRVSYLINRFKTDDRRYKLLLSQGDRDAFMTVVDGNDPPADVVSQVLENTDYFETKLKDPKLDIAVVCRGLSKLRVVDVKLQLGVDHPQLVFEAMNSTGKKLSQADLIRNFVLMDLPTEEQKNLWKTYWRPMELEFAKAGASSRFDEFVRHYLTVVTGDIPRVSDIYDAFKDYAVLRLSEGEAIDALVVELREYSKRFCAIALGTEPDASLRTAFGDLMQIRADVVYPFLLEVYSDYELKILSREDLIEIVRMVTSYVFRRAIVGLATNSLNTTFQTFGRALRKDRYLESVKAHFLKLGGYRQFPADAEFAEKLQTFDAYHFKRRSYFLRMLENFGRKEPVPTDEYTIEHILPQNEELRPEWEKALGADWQEIQAKYLHTLGNLTLTGYNSEYSDRPFSEKRDMKGGFHESPLRLNQGIGKLETWNDETIRERASRLAHEALTIWTRPSLPPETIAGYQEARAASGYSLEDHANLLRPARRAHFDLLQESILELDPAIDMQFLKVRVTFKAETTFLDVVPQAARLLLVLNIPIAELRDERGIARDVSEVGHWGAGDVQVPLDDESDFAYVMDLVRQAYEFQLTDSE
ncbi:DUF262 and DUF1524 domain-containing protein [Salinibacterium sp. SWN1162]|uniref:DUF262 and DUF1524 domain-containing protein n=1 Tax=Salinibacterium sp. SWN1162 TaxID=2792053 RepID=UPI0018CD9658|nr:DUF262 and DUF1524 domain-containing protein [Salinibacterium sp. SWN1162]MBH0007954.1 DUF262 domain-containing protein [Salinibacterium sp. SWN1162]